MSQTYLDWSRILTRASLVLASIWIVAVLALGGLGYWAWEADKKAPITASRSPALLLTLPAAPAPADPQDEPEGEPQS